MESFLDELIFDDRTRSELFEIPNLKQPFYADVVKRWLCGSIISKDEKQIIASVMIYFPEYILMSGKSKEILEFIRHSIQNPEIKNSTNPEKGLYFYTLLFLMIITGETSDLTPLLIKIKKILNKYNGLLMN
jgi:hypothetical protein